MDRDQLRHLLEQVRTGAVDVDAALDRVRHLPFEDLGFAKVDHHRALRHGMPEVVLAEGKTPEQVVAIAGRLLDNSPNVLITRANQACAAAVRVALAGAEHFPLSGTLRFWRDRTVRGRGTIAVVCAGTSDMPVAEEAQITAEVMGNTVVAIHDVGVAGIHRLMHHRESLMAARVVVVCAGMEGALPSAVGGWIFPHCARRLCFLPGNRRPHQRRLRRELSWLGGLAGDAQQLRQQRGRGEHRQRFRSWLRGQPDQPALRGETECAASRLSLRPGCPARGYWGVPGCATDAYANRRRPRRP